MFKKGFHYIFTWKIAVLLLLGLLASDAVFYYITRSPIEGTYGHAWAALNNVRDTALPDIIKIDLYVFIIIAVLIFFASLLMSHRISGPLYRFMRTAEALAGGDLSVRVKLREKDEMKDVAGEMEAAVRELRDRMADIRSAAEELKETAERLEAESGHAGGGRETELAGLVVRLSGFSKVLNDRLSYFRT